MLIMKLTFIPSFLFLGQGRRICSMEVIQSMNKHLFSYLPICSNDASESDLTSSLVYYYLPYRLRTKLSQSLLLGLPRDFLIPPSNPSELQQLLAKLCLELEESNSQFFENLCRNISITSENARSTFFSVGKEIIKDGINWGRIISIFTFTGILSHHFMLLKQPQAVVEMASTLCSFLNEHVMPWINKNGGWVSSKFVSIRFMFISNLIIVFNSLLDLLCLIFWNSIVENTRFDEDN